MTLFNENALALAPWSATKQKLATKCPFRAFYAFVDKEPEVHTEILNDSPMIVGIKMHTFMELVLAKFPDDEFPDLFRLQTFGQRILHVILKDEDMTYRETDAINSLYDRALNMCQRLLAHKFNSNAQSFIEIPVGIDKDFQPTDFFSKDAFFRGKIDYMLLNKNGSIAIIDHKTGAWVHLKSHASQLRAYEVMAFHSLKKRFSEEYNIKITSFISGLAHIAEETVLWDKVKPIQLVEGSCSKGFVDSINEVANLVFEKKIKRGPHCNACGYKHLCGSKRGMKKKKEAQVLT